MQRNSMKYCFIFLLIIVSMVKIPITAVDFFDVRPTRQHISYLYAPGIMATEMTMGRYCPQFTAVTGEKFTCRHAAYTIGYPHSAVVFPEIDLRKPGYFTLN